MAYLFLVRLLTRAHILLVAAAFTVAPCYAGKSLVRDGSTKEKAIPLKQRGVKAIEEEMAWMMKLYHYTPLLATRDAVADAIRQIKAGKKKSVENLHPWEHGSLDHNGHLISYWSFVTPRGKKEIYFDTGTRLAKRPRGMIVQALGEPSLLGAGEPSTNRFLTDAESNGGGPQGEAELSVLECHLGSGKRSKSGISVHVFRAGRRWVEC